MTLLVDAAPSKGRRHWSAHGGKARCSRTSLELSTTSAHPQRDPCRSLRSGRRARGGEQGDRLKTEGTLARGGLWSYARRSRQRVGRHDRSRARVRSRRHACGAAGQGPDGAAGTPPAGARGLRAGASPRARQSLPAHGLPARSRDGRGRHPDLSLASRPVRSGQRLHVRPVGGRRANLSGRGPRGRRLGTARVRPCRPGGSLAPPARGRHGPRSGSGRRQGGARPVGRRPASIVGAAPGRAVRRAESGRLGCRPDDPHRSGQPAAGAAGGGDLPRPVPRRAARRWRLRRPGTTPRPRPARQHRRPCDPAALVAALDGRAPSRRCGAHPAHRDRRWCRAGGAGRAAARGRDRAGLRRWRPRARLHQQGPGMPRPDRLGARCRGAAVGGRADGGGARGGGDHGLAAAGGSRRPHRERPGGAAVTDCRGTLARVLGRPCRPWPGPAGR